MPVNLPPMAVEPVPLVVAQARVHDDAAIQVLAPGVVRVRRGQPLVVKYQYKFAEASRNKEQWRFYLNCQVDGVEKNPIRTRWGDRFGIRDEQWGVLQQEYVFHRPGTHEARFHVRCNYSQVGWRRHDLRHEEERRANGGFRVVVEK